MSSWTPPPLLTVLAVPALVVAAGAAVALAQLIGLTS